MTTHKFGELKKELQKTGFISASLVLFFFSVNWFYEYKAQDLVQTKATLESEVVTLNSKLNELNAKSSQIKEAVALWKTLNEHAGSNTGLKIDEAKNSMDILKEKYFINDDISINLTPPKELIDAFKTENTVVVESEVDMRFSGPSDLHVLNFIDQFTKELSGFVKITNLKITKSQDFTDALATDIRKGNSPKIVDTELRFYWRDLKDTGK